MPRYWTEERLAGERRLTFPSPGLVFSRKQAEYLASDNPRELMCAGRGVGKDHLALLKKVLVGVRGYLGRRNDPTWSRAGARYMLAVLAGDEKSYTDCIAKLHDFVPQVPGYNAAGEPNYHFSSERIEWTLWGRNEFVIRVFNLYRAEQSKNSEHGRFRGPGFDDCLVTEAQKLSPHVIEGDIMPMVVRGGFQARITLNGTPADNWFDSACDEAEEGRGYFGNWSLWTATSFDNPLNSAEVAEQMLRERDKNPWRFDRERMAARHVRMPSETVPDCPFALGMVEAALYSEPVSVQPGQVVVAWDLFYGGNDTMTRFAADKVSCKVFDIRSWRRGEFAFDVKHPDYTGFVGLFEQAARQWPGCRQVYDTTGPYGAGIGPALPPHLRQRVIGGGEEQSDQEPACGGSAGEARGAGEGWAFGGDRVAGSGEDRGLGGGEAEGGGAEPAE